MIKFSDLIQGSVLRKNIDSFDHFADVGRQQDLAAQELIVMLGRSSLHSWKPGDPVFSAAARFLVGVAPWSQYDMELLDRLNSRNQERVNDVQIDVFDFFANCTTQSQLDLYVPGIKIAEIYHTPVVGKWINGAFVEANAGAKGRQWILEDLGLR